MTSMTPQLDSARNGIAGWLMPIIAAVVMAVAIACTSETPPEPTSAPAEIPAATTASQDVAPTADAADPTTAATPANAPESVSLRDTLIVGPSTTPEPVPDLIPPIPTADVPRDVPEDIGIIWEAYRILVSDYFDNDAIQPELMSEQAIRAMIETLGDAHTRYVSPEAFQLSRDDLAGEFFGIGASVSPDPAGSGVIITAPHRGSPAEEAGIMVGDRILAVDGEDATTWTVTEAVLRIRGERGDPVVLTILHAGADEPVDIVVVRDRVPLLTVTSRMIPDTEYGELDIGQFSGNTAEEIREHMVELLEMGAKGVVIDLRDNPGGLLHATIDSTSEFIAGRELLAYELDRDGNRRNFTANGNGNFADVPIVLLVNNWSGSGAELFAGAIQDHGRAVLIGKQTFGKGSVNHTRRLSNGGGVNVTIRRWFTPNGNVIEGVGLKPDVDVDPPDQASERDADFTDPQMDAAIRQLDFQTRVTTFAAPAGALPTDGASAHDRYVPSSALTTATTQTTRSAGCRYHSAGLPNRLHALCPTV